MSKLSEYLQKLAQFVNHIYHYKNERGLVVYTVLESHKLLDWFNWNFTQNWLIKVRQTTCLRCILTVQSLLEVQKQTTTPLLFYPQQIWVNYFQIYEKAPKWLFWGGLVLESIIPKGRSCDISFKRYFG